MPDKVAQDQVMPLPLAKRMLSMAESEPLGCAFGLTKDKKECMLLIQKSGSGKKVAAKLRADGKDLALDPGTVRFGRVHFQLPDDPGTVRFTVNRSEAGGTIVSLTRSASGRVSFMRSRSWHRNSVPTPQICSRQTTPCRPMSSRRLPTMPRSCRPGR